MIRKLECQKSELADFNPSSIREFKNLIYLLFVE